MRDENAGKVNALVGYFYRATLELPLEEFRRAMLQEVRTLIPFDAATWGVAGCATGHLHTLTLVDLPARFGKLLDEEENFRSLMGIMQSETGQGRVSPWTKIDPEDFHESRVYREVCQPFGIKHVLGTAYFDELTSLYSTIALFRCEDEAAFSRDDRRIIRHLIFHLMNAASMASSVHLQKHGRKDTRHGSAICDAFGYSYGYDEQFGRLIKDYFPGWRGDRLPFALPLADATGHLVVEGLRLKLDIVGELYFLTAWREGPLDSLTDREREIVVSVCRGLSYKEVARPLGIAPSTVSNHLYRVFEKLGITSRTELAKMVGENARLH